MPRETVYEDALRVDWRDADVYGTDWKVGSPSYNQQQVRQKLQDALDNWGTLTALNKDNLLRFLIRQALGDYRGQ